MMEIRTSRNRDPSTLNDRRYQMVLDHSREGIYVTAEDGRFLDVNPAMLDLLGFTRKELLETTLHDLCWSADDRERLMDALARRSTVRDTQVRLRRKDGDPLSCLLCADAELEGNGTVAGYHGMVFPVEDSAEAEVRIRHATLHDGLTQLPNRTFFIHRLERLLERRLHRAEYRFGVYFVDFDRFKLINDSLGHRVGDELLILIAQRLSELVRPEDIVARFGGDEFAVLAVDLPGQPEAELVAKRIHKGMLEPFHVLGHTVYVSPTIGIALSTDDHTEAEEVIRDADTAMHAAKGGAISGWAIFTDAMHERSVVRFATEMALRQAVENEEFVLHYQPIVEVTSRRIVGFEALVRWDHPERGLVFPDEFLRVAEETGLIVPIGQWVLEEACRTLAEWRAIGLEDGSALVMAVNISGRQFQVPGLTDQVRNALAQSGLPGEALHIEITETVLMENSELVRGTLAELAELGVLLCLDDFGTGYSSLGYLRDLPVASLKIDRGFVSGMGDTPGRGVSGMVETILSLSQRLDIQAVAEGVETEAQLEFLISLGCVHAQGFLFSRPVERDQARSLLQYDLVG